MDYNNIKVTVGNEAIELPTQTSKTTATLLNSWVNHDVAKYGEVKYWKVGGQVFFKGVVSGGVNLNTVFNLPEGFRPLSSSVLIPMHYTNGVSARLVDFFTISLDGNMSGSLTTPQYLILDGSFTID